jgi:DNA-binding transcriptional ArsR family regulator
MAMPSRALVTKELADLLSVLAHPHRLRIVEELRDQELDVNSLQEALGISHSGVSQHLSLLRARRLVTERREGRRVFYRLRRPEMAAWLLDGTTFIEIDANDARTMRRAIEHARAAWATS